MRRVNNQPRPVAPAKATQPSMVPVRSPRGQNLSQQAVGKDGSVAHFGGSLAELTPLADQAPGLDQTTTSGNLGSVPGGEPVFASVDVENNIDEPRAKKWLVLADRQLSQQGQRFTLRAGKVIDEANYDIPLLRRQGVKLKPYEAGDEGYEPPPSPSA